MTIYCLCKDLSRGKRDSRSDTVYTNTNTRINPILKTMPNPKPYPANAHAYVSRPNYYTQRPAAASKKQTQLQMDKKTRGKTDRTLLWQTPCDSRSETGYKNTKNDTKSTPFLKRKVEHRTNGATRSRKNGLTEDDAKAALIIKYFNLLIGLLETNKELKRTFKGMMIQAVWAVVGIVIGGFLAGPAGAAAGGAGGIAIGYGVSDDYSSMIKVIKNFSYIEKKQLVKKVQNLVGSASLDALIFFIGPQVKGGVALLNCIRSFLENEGYG